MIIFNIYNASNDLFVNLFIVLLISSYIAVINILINYIIYTHTHTHTHYLIDFISLMRRICNSQNFPYIHNS